MEPLTHGHGASRGFRPGLLSAAPSGLRQTAEGHSRRGFLTHAAAAGFGWMTLLGETMARAAAPPTALGPKRATSVILLWMQGGPSQLETFDPHPGTLIGGDAKAIATSAKGVKIADNLPRVADQMHSVALIRSMVSREGDHEKGTYNVKTGFRPDPTVVHPSIGAVLCHQLPGGGTDIPRHVSILPNQWSGRGGYLGEQFDAFRTGDPRDGVPDTRSYLPAARDDERMKNLDVIESAFAKRRKGRAEATMHRDLVARAKRLMTSEQLKAFDVSSEPAALREEYGDTPFGRACLAARRLTETGVRCVEVTLDGWDTHANNHSLTRGRTDILDPAFAALVKDLRSRGRLDTTMVIWAGEFGRTPKINPVGGRDHWPNSFSVALAGGGVRGGVVLGETDPAGKDAPTKPVSVGDLHATVLHAAGIDHQRINQTPIGRTVPFAEGRVVEGVLGG